MTDVIATPLWQVAERYRADAAKLQALDLDEQTLQDTLEGMSGEVEERAQAVAHVARGMHAEAEAIKLWIKQAQERVKAVEARRERLESYLSEHLNACGITKVTGPGIAISFRKSTSVEILDEAQIPREYMVRKPPPAPEVSKSLLSDALKKGVDVPGARLVERQNIQIK